MKNVDEYFRSVDIKQKKELLAVRQLIRERIPEAIEKISYGMPVFVYKNKYLIGYASFKNHMSIFPGSSAIEELKNELKDYRTSKGTIQFTTDNPVSFELLQKIITICKQRIDRN